MITTLVVTRAITGGALKRRNLSQQEKREAFGIIFSVSMESYKALKALGQETGGHTSKEQQVMWELAPPVESNAASVISARGGQGSSMGRQLFPVWNGAFRDLKRRQFVSHC